MGFRGQRPFILDMKNSIIALKPLGWTFEAILRFRIGRAASHPHPLCGSHEAQRVELNWLLAVTCTKAMMADWERMVRTTLSYEDNVF